MAKKYQKYLVDVVLAAFLWALMSSQAMEQATHEFTGLAVIFALALHQALNAWWYRAPWRLDAVSMTRNALNIALLTAFGLTFISGVAMSESALAFARGAMKISLARELHLCASHWLFVLAGLHAGLHAAQILPRVTFFARLAAALLAAYGFYAFLDMGGADYLLGRVKFAFLDHKTPLLSALWQVAASAFAWVFIGSQIARIARKTR